MSAIFTNKNIQTSELQKLNFYEHKSPGKLITFCGLDGCGKTTLISLLNDYFYDRSHEVLLTKQPTLEFRKTAIFRNVQDTLDHAGYDYRAMSLMAAADRLQHCTNFILPALKAGKIILCDRYFFSCLINLRARGYYNDKWIYEIARYIPKPDIAFFFDLDVETAIKRVRDRPEEKEKYIDVGLQYKLKQEYTDIALENGGIIVNTEYSPQESFQIIQAIVEQSGLFIL